MEQFLNLESLYAHLNEHALTYPYPHQIGRLFEQVRDLAHQQGLSDDAKEAQWEVDFWNFVIAKGELKAKFLGNGEGGKPYEYPSLVRFGEETYAYLAQRLADAGNDLLKARYATILWHSPKKHTKYALAAVDSYVALAKAYEDMDGDNPGQHWGLSVLECIQNALGLANQARCGVDNVAAEARRLALHFNFDSTCSFALRAGLIEMMLERKRTFQAQHFDGLEAVCWTVSDGLVNAGNLHAAIQVLALGERVDAKLEKRSHEWARRSAEHWETLMAEAESKNNPASVDFCLSALRFYRSLRDEIKIKELEGKYSRLKSSLTLMHHDTEIDLTKHLAQCRRIAARIADHPSEEILAILASDPNLLPKRSYVEKQAEEHTRAFPLTHLFPSTILDQSGNPAQQFSTDEEKKLLAVLREYQWSLEFDKVHLINEILLTAIRRGKLTLEVLLRLLRERTWIGQELSRPLPNGQALHYRWLDLISPALSDYFAQLSHLLTDPQFRPNWVLVTDSLTLKVEGMVRDICCLSGVSTSYETTDNAGHRVVREKDINQLLREDSIKSLVREDDLLFLKFLLVEKAGYNLRHRVAHALMIAGEYGLGIVQLLLLAVLRLARFTLEKRE